MQNTARAVSLTGSASPTAVPTGAQMQSRLTSLLARTDHFEMTGVSCTGRRCGSYTPESLNIDFNNASAVMIAYAQTDHALTTWQGASNASAIYGTLMDHSAFGFARVRDGSSSNYFGFAAGDHTGRETPARATWQGVMVGSFNEGSDEGDTLHGKAMLSTSILDYDLRADFTDIYNLTDGKSIPETVRITSLRVKEGGLYRKVTCARYFGSSRLMLIGRKNALRTVSIDAPGISYSRSISALLG